eukprot:TRINITY_DN4808_c0_g1_i1.p1 TRINITY_DN4808_c0_g1~~TRINITY_DN4808_c0_g1_i1.p1  ORF type:complete len:1265 (-),score=222.84 TRINITY_DN4808_c0_g1_i1:176-3907(-)
MQAGRMETLWRDMPPATPPPQINSGDGSLFDTISHILPETPHLGSVWSLFGGRCAICTCRGKPDAPTHRAWDTADLTWWDFKKRYMSTMWFAKKIRDSIAKATADYDALVEKGDLDGAEKLWEASCTANAIEVREHAEYAKGLFVKATQQMSTMTGILPDEYCNEFMKTTESLPVSSPDEVYRVIERNLQWSPFSIFGAFDQQPVASASIGQVHKARLRREDGTLGELVAVKVQHDGVDRVFTEDLRTLMVIAEKVAYWKPEMDFRPLVEEWQDTLPRELNFLVELEAAQRASEALARVGSSVIVPAPMAQFSGPQVLVMEFIVAAPIISLAEPEFCSEHNLDKKEIMLQLLNAFGTLTFGAGLLHGDPHAGNLRFMIKEKAPGGAVPVIFDWGMTRILSDDERLSLAKFFHALANLDMNGAFEALDHLGFKFGDRKGQGLTDALREELFGRFRGMMKDTVSKDQTRANVKAGIEETNARMEQNQKLMIVDEFPKCIVFLLRMCECLRGLFVACDVQGLPVLEVFARHARCAFIELSQQPSVIATAKLFSDGKPHTESTPKSSTHVLPPTASVKTAYSECPTMPEGTTSMGVGSMATTAGDGGSLAFDSIDIPSLAASRCVGAEAASSSSVTVTPAAADSAAGTGEPVLGQDSLTQRTEGPQIPPRTAMLPAPAVARLEETEAAKPPSPLAVAPPKRVLERRVRARLAKFVAAGAGGRAAATAGKDKHPAAGVGRAGVVGAQVAVLQGGRLICDVAVGTLSTIDMRPVESSTLFPLMGLTAGIATLAFLHELHKGARAFLEKGRKVGDHDCPHTEVLQSVADAGSRVPVAPVTGLMEDGDRAAGQPSSPSEPLLLGRATESSTASALADCRGLGLLDAHVAQLWPAFGGGQSKVTLRQLLGHAAGLQDAFPPNFGLSHLNDLASVWGHLEQTPLPAREAEPHYAYILQTFAIVKLLGRLSEGTSGDPASNPLILLQRSLRSMGMDVCMPIGRGQEAFVCRDLPSLAKVSMSEVERSRELRKQKMQEEFLVTTEHTNEDVRAKISLMEACTRSPVAFDPLQANVRESTVNTGFRAGLPYAASAVGLASTLSSPELQAGLQAIGALEAQDGYDPTALGWLLTGGATRWTAGGLQVLDVAPSFPRRLYDCRQKRGYGIICGLGPCVMHFPDIAAGGVTIAVTLNDVLRGRESAIQLISEVLSHFGYKPTWTRIPLRVVNEARQVLASSSSTAPMLRQLFEGQTSAI